jgi:hypothetical protein
MYRSADEFFSRGRLDQEPRRSVCECVEERMRIIQGRAHDDPGAMTQRPDLAQKGQAIHLMHANVERHDVGKGNARPEGVEEFLRGGERADVA